MNRQLLARIANWIAILGLLNFFVFFGVAMYLGGDAVNGKAENGHYYLANHGKYTEVDEATFNYSRYHVYSVWVSWPFVMLSGGLCRRTKG